jgi:hypothetical protein
LKHYVKFEKNLQKTTILTPSTGFKPEIQVIERRKDTLLDRWCRINIERAKRPKVKAGDSTVLEIVEFRKTTLCPDTLRQTPPSFLSPRFEVD